LSHISGVDGIYHVVRAFPDADVMHNEGDIDPIRDIEIINFELRAKDLQQVDKELENLETALKRSKEMEKKKIEAEKATLTTVK